MDVQSQQTCQATSTPMQGCKCLSAPYTLSSYFCVLPVRPGQGAPSVTPRVPPPVSGPGLSGEAQGLRAGVLADLGTAVHEVSTAV